jgi:hypothetical protein
MKYQIPSVLILVMLLNSACGQAQPANPPPETPGGATAASPGPVQRPTGTPSPAPVMPSATPELPDYTRVFLEQMGTREDSCMPDKTNQCISVYVYDLDRERELVAINEDIPLQYASAFKGPVLIYFLERCKKYWDVNSVDWNSFYLGSNPPDPWYVSDEYKQMLRNHLADAKNWAGLDTFFYNNRVLINDVPGQMDARYLILQQAYKMVAQSNNYAAGILLKFVYDNCLPGPSVAIEERCGGSNAISEFNLWFNEFAGITYSADEPRRGLNSWDTIANTQSNGETQITRMPTYGLMDQCANQTALLACADNLPIPNVWTARDFFKFYYALFHMESAAGRTTAMKILAADDAGASRGYLKNMARNIGAASMSKNGYFGSILTDAGIVEYQGHSYIVVVLSYNAVESIIRLFGQYDPGGNPAGQGTGLLQKLLEGTLEP